MEERAGVTIEARKAKYSEDGRCPICGSRNIDYVKRYHEEDTHYVKRNVLTAEPLLKNHL